MELPIHRDHRKLERNSTVLLIDGLVAESLQLTSAALQRLQQHDFTNDFTCLEGWTVPDVKWGGVPLEVVLSRAKPAPQAHYVQASAGEFSILLHMDQVGRVLIATHLNDRALTEEHGGPFRLIVPGGDCFLQIKWLDHLELRKEPGENTAKRIALGRLATQKASRQAIRGV